VKWTRKQWQGLQASAINWPIIKGETEIGLTLGAARNPIAYDRNTCSAANRSGNSRRAQHRRHRLSSLSASPGSLGGAFIV
jgi:hypothetical protein